MLALGLGLCVASCRKNSAEEVHKIEKPEAHHKSVQAVSTGKPVVSEPKTPPEGPQTHEEYVGELGKQAKTNQSFGRRLAMAEEVLQARAKVLAEENESVKAAKTQVDTLQTQLVSVQQALADAEKALEDAYASDPEWKAAKEKKDEISKEADAAYAKTALMIQEAHKKGIHLRPKDLQQGTEAPAPSNP